MREGKVFMALVAGFAAGTIMGALFRRRTPQTEAKKLKRKIEKLDKELERVKY
jgi:uncharacterized membrane-anchored protein YhcB (DUF1043 family)